MLPCQFSETQILVIFPHMNTEFEWVRIISARAATRTERENMSQKRNNESDPDMLDECDFSNGVRGKYVDRFAKGSNVIVLDPDVHCDA